MSRLSYARAAKGPEGWDFKVTDPPAPSTRIEMHVAVVVTDPA